MKDLETVAKLYLELSQVVPDDVRTEREISQWQRIETLETAVRNLEVNLEMRKRQVGDLQGRLEALRKSFPTTADGPVTDSDVEEICRQVAHIPGSTMVEQVTQLRADNGILCYDIECLRKAANGIFDASDYTLGTKWRDDTLVTDGSSDRLNEAWVVLAKHLGQKGGELK